MKSWKTTLGGILLALGTPLAGLVEESWVKYVGIGLMTLGGLLVGVQARDHNVSSEDEGVK